MSISMQMPAMPQLATLLRSPPSLALALQAGQVLDAKVIGPGAGGTTRVELQGQLLNLLLAEPAQTGAVLRLKVEAVSPQIQLSVQPPPAASGTSAPTAAAQPIPAAPVSSAQTASPVPHRAPAVSPQSAASPSQGFAPAATRVEVAGMPAATAQAPTAPAPGVPTAPRSISAGGTVPLSPALGTAGAPVAPGAATLPSGPAAAGASAATPVLTGSPPSPLPNASGALPPAAPAGAVASPPAATPVSASPPNIAAPATPQQALAQMVQAALPRQGAATTLTATLATLVSRTGLPEPVMKAAQNLLSSRLELGGGTLTGAALKQAVANSGVFSESRLASAPNMPATDAKTALLELRSALGKWLGTSQQPIAAAAPIPPPVRGMTPRARMPDLQPVSAVDPAASVEEIGRQALERSEAALARMRLHQHAGLPDADGRPAPAMTLDLPVMVGTYQALLHLQIRQEAESREGGQTERSWQMRFAINLPATGEVGAQVSLRAGNVGVMLWATEEATAAALQSDIDLLRADMVAAGLQPGSLLVRHGEPAPPPAAAQSQHLLDALR